MLGIAGRLHDENTADDLGIVHAPPPIELGDLLATADDLYRVVDIVITDPASSIAALVKVRHALVISTT